jgi:tripartite-type tricarboxylate transporter receptor subunit TctC
VPSGKRSRQYPDIPTFAESGLADFDINSWVGLVAPAKTPRAIVERLNAELNAALADAEVRTKLEASGIAATPGTPDAFAATLRKELGLYGPVVKAAGIKLN